MVKCPKWSKAVHVAKIVKDADMLYSYLPQDGKAMPVPELETKAKLPSKDLNKAIGWLACKERINITENEHIQRV
jgi:heme oxygenase